MWIDLRLLAVVVMLCGVTPTVRARKFGYARVSGKIPALVHSYGWCITFLSVMLSCFINPAGHSSFSRNFSIRMRLVFAQTSVSPIPASCRAFAFSGERFVSVMT